MHGADRVEAADPFDLPDWLGTAEVTWTALSGVRAGARVEGELTAGEEHVGCDLLAVDQAFPEPVLAEEWRRRAHQNWTYGEVLPLRCGGRLTLAVPGTGFTADTVLEALGRLARAVGAAPVRFSATLRL